MLAQQIQLLIEHSISEISKSQFFTVIEQRPLSRRELEIYLTNIYYVLIHTKPHLKLAQTVSQKNSNFAFSQFFLEKEIEESGHDQWCEEDLRNLIGPDWQYNAQLVTPAIHQLMDLQEKAILENPLKYIGYITLNESFTVAAGPKILNRICPQNAAAGPENVAMSCLEKHVSLDQHHVQDDYVLLGNLMGQSSNPPQVLQHIEMSSQLISNFFNEVTNESAASSLDQRQDSSTSPSTLGSH